MSLADEIERLHEALLEYGRPSPEVGAIAYRLVDAAPRLVAVLRAAEDVCDQVQVDDAYSHDLVDALRRALEDCDNAALSGGEGE